MLLESLFEVFCCHLGQVVETANSEDIFASPLHPYTQALLSAIPITDYYAEKKRTRITLQGEVPSPLNVPSGCPFHPRCPYATDICREKMPDREVAFGDHEVACHHYKELLPVKQP